MSKDRNIEAIYPLTPMQAGMLYHALSEPSTGIYFDQLYCILQGKLDSETFQRAWKYVISRHAVLRSAFLWERVGEPLQVVHRQVALPWQELDWRDLSSDEQQLQLQGFLKRERSEGLDWKRPPLLRLTLIRLADDRYHFGWSMHHILVDGWSYSLLFKELFASYEVYMQGKTPDFPPPPPYRDYVMWQRQRDLTEARRYWEDQLQGFTAPTPLLVDRHARLDTSDTPLCDELECLLTTEQTSALQTFARQHQLTLNTLAQAAWALLLRAYSGEQDVVFGVTSHGRPATFAQIGTMVGLFINTLPMRVKVNPETKLLPWMRDIHAQQSEMFQYDYSPLTQIQAWSSIPRGVALFESVVVFENYSVQATVQEQESQVRILQVRATPEQRNYPLMVGLAILPGPALRVHLGYRRDRFDEPTIRRLLEHYQTLLEAIVAQPEASLADLSPLTEAERERLLATRSTDALEERLAGSWQEIFEAQVERTPDALALVYEHEQITYRVLNQRVNQLAQYLQELGVGPEVPVGLSLKPSSEMVIGLLGILKAGGISVPLDPDYTEARFIALVDALQIPILLTRQTLRGQLPLLSGLFVFCLDSGWRAVSEQPPANLTGSVLPDNLAVVLSTTDSIDLPSGVLLPHNALFSHLFRVQNAFPLTTQDRVLQDTPLRSDASLLEMLGTLLAGSQLVLAQAEVQQDTTLLARLLSEQSITVAHLSPSVLQSLLVSRDLQACQSLRRVYSSRENFSDTYFQQVSAACPAEIHPIAGVAEIALSPAARPDIGSIDHQGATETPGAKIHVYILDASLRPVPSGISGELYIGGSGLARGYALAPTLTAERFVPDPFSHLPGARLYRTGYIGRYLADRDVQFVGHVDRQIKIRGSRVLLDEVERALCQIQGVRESAVLDWEDTAAGKYLVAYVVLEPSENISPEKLRQALQNLLPVHMLPATYIVLDALPRTLDGTVDRQRLPAPEETRDGSEGGSALPLTPIEEIIVNICKQVLENDQVDIHDNFFELGGHSLLATQVISRIAEIFTIEIPIGAILTTPTVAHLAAILQDALQEERKLKLLPLEAQARPANLPFYTLPLSFAQQRLWFLDQLAPGSPFYNVPNAVRLQEQLNLIAFEQSLAEVVRRHEILRTAFVQSGEHVAQRIAPKLSIVVPVIDMQALDPVHQQKEVQRLVNQESSQPFDLSSAPLLRVTLLRLASQEHILLLTMHHIIADGWSVIILLRELITLYTAFTRNRPSPLPEPSIQYADFAQWQRQWLQGEVLEQQLIYWREQLRDVPVLQLPVDHPHPQIAQFRGTYFSFQLSPSLSQAVQSFSRQEGVTLYMTLLASFQVLLWRYTGQEDLVIGMPVANRTRKEIEALIGFFVNLLVLRIQLDGNLSVRELVQRVCERTLEAHAHQDMPFEYLVEQLQPERDLSRNPFVQVTLMLHNIPSSATDALASSPTALSVENSTAKFDLSLALQETADGLKGSWAYSTDLFEAETIQRMHRHWQDILEALVADPKQKLQNLPLTTLEERTQILRHWNTTAVDFPQPHSLPLLVEQQVERTPDAVAAIFEDQILTYRALDLQANLWAHRLHQQGVGAESLVGVCMSRSLEMFIAVLAILKAGGAYVPLDPTLPQERLRLIVQDAQISLLLTQPRWSETVAPLVPTYLCLDAEASLLTADAYAPPPRQVQPDNLAYVIYTSGSTGVPKGVMISQRGICNRLFWAQRIYQMTPQESILQKSPLTFDISIEEFFWPLLVGAHTVIARPEGQRDSEYLVQTIVEQQITILRLVTPQLAVFAETPGLEACHSLRLLICGGETLVQEVVQRFYTRLPSEVVLHNFYGATEASVDSTFWPCGPEQARGVVPIGRPMDNVAMYVLNKYLQPVPAGVSGEIYIGGISLARGYLGQPGLTAERFVPDPHGETEGSRLYRTGDQGRYLADGTLEFLGRTDTQVKVRGYRIELGEIEATLSEHPGVQDAIVVVQEDSQGNKRLASYITQDPAWQGERQDIAGSEAQGEHLEDWQLVFNETYRQTSSFSDSLLNFSGWNSSYTGEPLTEPEMQEWLEQALKGIQALSPARVLEIGCGTGLLLFNLAPQAHTYCGTDFSEVVLASVRQQLAEAGERFSHVELRQRDAADFTGWPRESFDTIILNSVVQYFPSIEYLLDMLKASLEVLAPGGHLFIGDVRSLPLLSAFHTTVALEQAPPSLSCTQLQQQILQHLAQEKELTIDPAFFVALQHAFPQISHVQIEPERGQYQNELTQFRYNVSISVKDEQLTPVQVPWLDWSEEQCSLPALRALLTEQRPVSLGIRRVPNARVQRSVSAVAALMQSELPATVADLRDQLQTRSQGLDPQSIWDLGDELAYTVEISWSSAYPDGSFDVVLSEGDRAGQVIAFSSGAIPVLKPWASYANRPQPRKAAQALTTHVQQWLRDRLPEYMLPVSWTVLDHFPLTANGKFNRQALPATHGERPELGEAFVAPRTTVEIQLAEIWGQVLGIERIGIHDNFFALGGHSLLATQVLSRIVEAFETELSLSILFQMPTIAELAEQIMQSAFELEDADILEQLLVKMESER